MSTTVEVEEQNHGLESIGPFNVWKLRLDGFAVPFLTGREDDKGMFHLCLDERFGMEVPKEYAHQVVSMIANAYAIGAGYSCFGENSQKANPFKVKMCGLSVTPEIEMEEISSTAS